MVYLVTSLFSLFWLPIRRGPERIGWTDTVADALNLPLLHNLFGVLMLFLLTGALVRRKRFALWLVILTQVFGVLYGISMLVRRLSGWRLRSLGNQVPTTYDEVMAYVGGVLGLVLVGVLWWARPAFPARRSPGSYGIAALTAVIGLAASALITIGLALSTKGGTQPAGPVVVDSLRAAWGLDLVLPSRGVHIHPWLGTTAGVMSALVLLASVTVFLRSSRGPDPLSEADELTVRTMLATGSHDDSLGYFATRRDKSLITSADGKAAVSYRVIASVSLASADPLGEPGSWSGAIDAWLDEARRYGWVPAALSPGREGTQAYVDAGLRAIPLGDEAVIDAEHFALLGPEMKQVRQAVTRVRRAGYTIAIRRHVDIEPEEMAALIAAAERWRGDAPERGFSMALSRLGDPVDERCLMVTASDGQGEIVGLLSFVPWGRAAVSLDLMRRDRASVNGVIEMMVTALIERRAEFGIRRISLNFAMFRSVFARADELGAGPLVRLNNAVLGVFSRFFQLESLYRSNAKYQPAWIPRYLCLDSGLSLPRVSVAAGVAEGFLPQLPTKDRKIRTRSEPELQAAVRQLDAAQLARPLPTRRLKDQERVRRDHLVELQRSGMTGYPVQVPSTVSLADLPFDAPDRGVISVVGRVRATRDFGGVCFAVLVDRGVRLQVVLERAAVPAEQFRLWRRTVDPTDIVSVTGRLGYSRSGHPSLLAQSWVMASKSLRALPPLYGSFTDPEARLRDRSADLLVNERSAELVGARSRAVDALRRAFADRGFREVETPILQPIHGGATARPFRTHINAYSRDLTLRIAPELYLKRLVVGGSGPIFEMARNFRNEGADATHNPEFTSLEAYRPLSDYDDLRRLTTAVIREVARAVNGEEVVMRRNFDGTHTRVRLPEEWPAVPVHEAVSKACGVMVDPGTPVADLLPLAEANGVRGVEELTAGEIVSALYEHLVEPATESPTFYCDFPIETSPLTRPNRTDPRLAERWDLVAFGMELGTAYSELTDPIDQRDRLTRQSLRAAAGDEEAMELDEDFLSALELGMPPTGGLGIGVDRLIMLLTGEPIRSVLTFPFVRPLDRR